METNEMIETVNQPETVELFLQDAQLTDKQLDFIEEMVAHGRRITAYKKVYGVESNSVAKSGACRLMANLEIRERIIKRRALLFEVDRLLVLKHYKQKILSIAEKRAVLADILRQNIESRSETVRSLTGTVTVKTDVKALLRALELDTKLEYEGF